MFEKSPHDPRQVLWRPKPKSAAEVKAKSSDHAAAALARKTPTSRFQTLLNSKATK
jgi:hypothetical protein